MSKKIIRGGTIVTAVDTVAADVLIDGEKIAGVGDFDGVDAEVLDATGLLRAAGRDRQPHAPLDAVRRHHDRRRLRHRHAGRGRGRHDLPRRLRAADGARAACAPRSSSGWAAPRAPRTSTTASTWRSRRPTPARSPTWRRWSTRACPTFKVFLAYPNVLMVTDDLFLAVLERSKETGGLVMVHGENGFAIDHLVKKALAAGDTDPIYHALTRPEEFEAEATGRAIRLAEYAGAPIYIVHVSCKRGRGRGHRGPRARRAAPTARPASSTSSPRSTTCAGPTSRARATSARRRCATPPTSRTCGTRSTSTTCSRSRPTTARSTTSRSGSASATSRRSRTASRRSSTGCRCSGSTASRAAGCR